jgi:hypothetical protein
MAYPCLAVFCEVVMFELVLDWPVAGDYVVRPTAAYGVEGEPGIYPADGGTVRHPLEGNPTLYREFACLDSEQAYLDFARKNGLLFTIPGGATGHEALSIWRTEIERVRRLIEFCEIGAADPRQALRKFAPQEVPLVYGQLDPVLSLQGPLAPPVLSLRCDSLLCAIELQAILAILRGRKSHQCVECSNWFEIGSGARRSIAKFCSDQCKNRFHNRRKKEERTP